MVLPLTPSIRQWMIDGASRQKEINVPPKRLALGLHRMGVTESERERKRQEPRVSFRG